ncbi:SIR2 family protein, partial [Aurantimonas sp. C2-4-R8]|nr:SIR2 family protein [Aurantimonas sp. C2-4-R8]
MKIVNARDVAKATSADTQIVKFHGDFEDDQSLVIAETDYFNRLTFDSPLDIKFRADALGRTILFVGYSVSDLNIRLLLHRLWLTWRDSGREKDRPRSFVFMSRENPVQEAVLGQWGISVLSDKHDEPADALLSSTLAILSGFSLKRGSRNPARRRYSREPCRAASWRCR